MKRKSENKNQIRENVKKGSGPEMPFLILGSKNHYGFSNQKKHLKFKIETVQRKLQKAREKKPVKKKISVLIFGTLKEY